MSTVKSASKKSAGFSLNAIKESRYVQSLKYAFYVITHPFDGFWDLIHEKRGSLAAAHTFLVLFLLTRVIKLMCTSFQFIS